VYICGYSISSNNTVNVKLVLGTGAQVCAEPLGPGTILRIVCG
jgi:hypothetical protein